MMTSASALLSGQTPLAVRMRPVSLAEVAGQKHLLRAGSPIVALADPAAGGRVLVFGSFHTVEQALRALNGSL